MSTKTVTTEVVSKTEEQSATRKTLTNWKVFEDAGFIPTRVKCDGYKSTHPADLSCHTAIVPSAENVIRHCNPDHGLGTFRVKFRVSDGKKSPLWGDLEKAGYELKEFWCPHCRESITVSPRRIMYHLNPHPGANRVNLDPQVLCMWIGTDSMEELDESDGLYERD